MACGLGFPAEQCAEDHWKRSLGGGKVGQHYRLRCPVCGKNGCLEVTVKSTGILYRCWYKSPGSKKEAPRLRHRSDPGRTRGPAAVLEGPQAAPSRAQPR